MIVYAAEWSLAECVATISRMFVSGLHLVATVSVIVAMWTQPSPMLADLLPLQLDRSTFIGGSSADRVSVVTIDDRGYLYIAGSTASQDFINDHQSIGHHGVGLDMFVASLSPDGQFTATILAGNGANDLVLNGVLDAVGRFVIVGTTDSTDLPISDGAVQRTLGGARDAFFVIFDSLLGSIEYATYIGGLLDDAATAVVGSAAGGYLVTGATFSGVNLLPPGVVDNLNRWGDLGSSDGFLLRINPDSLRINDLLLLGGPDYDSLSDLVIAPMNNPADILLVGETMSPTIDTVDAYQPTFAGGASDGLWAIVSPEFAVRRLSFLGGSSLGRDAISSVTANANGFYLAGTTSSPDLIRELEPLNTYGGEPSDGFVLKMDSALNVFEAGTYVGGVGLTGDLVTSVEVMSDGRVVIGGTTDSKGVLPERYAGARSDAFSLVFSAELDETLPSLGRVGGEASDRGFAVTTSANRIVLVGSTDSDRFPVLNPVQGVGFGETGFLATAGDPSTSHSCAYIASDALFIADLDRRDIINVLAFPVGSPRVASAGLAQQLSSLVVLFHGLEVSPSSTLAGAAFEPSLRQLDLSTGGWSEAISVAAAESLAVASGFAYIGSRDTVQVVDLRQNRLLDIEARTSGPVRDIAIAEPANILAVATQDALELFELETLDLVTTKELTPGCSPSGLAFLSDGRLAVSCFASAEVLLVLPIPTGEVAVIGSVARPQKIVAEGDTAYISHIKTSTVSTLSTLNTSTEKFVAELELAGGVVGMGVMPQLGNVFAVTSSPDLIVYLDITSGRIFDAFPLSAPSVAVAVGEQAVPCLSPFLCGGDCDQNKQVQISDLILAVRSALAGSAALCRAADVNLDGLVQVGELITAVKNALGGC